MEENQKLLAAKKLLSEIESRGITLYEKMEKVTKHIFFNPIYTIFSH